MEIAFRKLPPVESLMPQPGDLFLVPASRSEVDSRRLASHVFAKGTTGLVRGEGPIKRILVTNEPKLDDMLALTIVQMELQGQLVPQGLDAFCRYAARLRDGIRPAFIPLECSIEGLFLAMRAQAESRLASNEAGQKLLSDWQRLADVILDAAKQQLDPASDLLFGARRGGPTTWGVPLGSVFHGASDAAQAAMAGPDFSKETEYLEKDRHAYERDLENATRGSIRSAGFPAPVDALILSQPKCALLKYWTRSLCPPPIGGPFPFLAIKTSPGQWIFSVDPSLKVSLKPLVDRLQAAEKSAVPALADKDPWFDGAKYEHVQIASPRGGTKLSDETVRRVLQQWGWLTPSGAKPRKGILVAVACLLIALAGAALGVLSRGGGSGDGTLAQIHDLYVLNVGVSDYANIPSLHSAAGDADALAAAFKRQQGALCPTVVTKVLKNSEATKREIIDFALREWLLAQLPLTRRSLVIVTFSGHGFVESGTHRYHFAPHDYDLQNQGSTGIFLDEIQRYLANLPCTSLVLFDTCHSGAADDADGDEARPDTLIKNIRKGISEGRDAKGLVVMAACGRYQKANETARWGHGALTLAVLEGLDGKYHYFAKDLFATPLPQPAPDGVITLKSLDRYATERVEALSSEISTPKYRRQSTKTFTVGDVSLGAIPIAVRRTN